MATSKTTECATASAVNPSDTTNTEKESSYANGTSSPHGWDTPPTLLGSHQFLYCLGGVPSQTVSRDPPHHTPIHYELAVD